MEKNYRLSGFYQPYQALDKNKCIFLDGKKGHWFVLDRSLERFIVALVDGRYDHSLAIRNQEWESVFNRLYREKIIVKDGDEPQYDYLSVGEISPSQNPYKLIIIEPSQFCNLKCTYCFEDNPTRGSRMKIEVADQIVESISLLPLGKDVIVEFNGAETFLNFEAFSRIVDSLGSKINGTNIRYTVQSSGTIMSANIAKYLFNNNVDVGISLDGPAYIHDKHRSFSTGIGTHKKIMENIDLMKSYGVNPSYLAVIETAYEFREAYKFISKLNPAIIKINLKRFNGRVTKHIPDEELVLIADADFEIFEQQLDEIRSGYRPPRLANICHMIENILLTQKPYMCLRTPCGAGSDQIVYDYAGNIWPCQEFIGDERFKAAGVDHRNPQEALYSSQAGQELRGRRLYEIDGCSTCSFQQFCQSGCSATAYYSRKMEDGRTMKVKTPHCAYYMRIFQRLLPLVADRSQEIIEYVFVSERGYSRKCSS